MPPYSEVVDEWPVQRQEIRIPSRRITPSPSSSSHSSSSLGPRPSHVAPLPSFRLREQEYHNHRIEALSVPSSFATRNFPPHLNIQARNPFLDVRDEHILQSSIRKRGREALSSLRYDEQQQEEEDNLRLLHRKMQLQRLREHALQRISQESTPSSQSSSHLPASSSPSQPILLRASIPTSANQLPPSNSFRNLRAPGFLLSPFSSSIRSPSNPSSSSSSSSSSAFFESSNPIERRQIFREKSIHPLSLPPLDETSSSSSSSEEDDDSHHCHKKEDEEDSNEELDAAGDKSFSNENGVSSDGIPYFCLLEDLAARYQLRHSAQHPQDDDDDDDDIDEDDDIVHDDDDIVDDDEEADDHEQQEFKTKFGLLKDRDHDASCSSSSGEEEEAPEDESIEEAQFPALAQLFMSSSSASSERQISKKPFPTKPQSKKTIDEE